MSENLQKLKSEILKISNDNKLCIAFSDGVDSTVLLKVAKDAGLDVLAVFVDTQLTDNKDNIKNASNTASAFGAEFSVIKIDMLSDFKIYSNDKMRCYFCKSRMFKEIKNFATEKGYQKVCDGTNADDLTEYRPGLKAKKEQNIESPIAECGLTKESVRQIAKELSLKVATKPSSPCLLTRFPYNTTVTKEMLSAVSSGEQILKLNGFNDCRLRIHKDIARIEIPKSDFLSFVSADKLEKIYSELKALGFSYITLDLSGLNSGSMDINI